MQCMNQIVAVLRHCCILPSTPSTRRQRDGVAAWSLSARFSLRDGILAEEGLSEEFLGAPDSPIDLRAGYAADDSYAATYYADDSSYGSDDGDDTSYYSNDDSSYGSDDGDDASSYSDDSDDYSDENDDYGASDDDDSSYGDDGDDSAGAEAAPSSPEGPSLPPRRGPATARESRHPRVRA